MPQSIDAEWPAAAPDVVARLESALHARHFTFWASPPYEPFVPLVGEEADLYFEDDVSNQALIELRRFIAGFVERVFPDVPQVWQWERHIEL
jgi:hypothetical protein